MQNTPLPAQTSVHHPGRRLLPILALLLGTLALLSLAQGRAAAIAPQSLEAISQKATLLVNADERIVSAVIDEAAGFAYFGTDTTPGTVIKVRLSDFSRVESLTFNEGEDKIESAAIDVAGGYAYFGTDTSPGIVVKVRLSDFKRVGALELAGDQNGQPADNKLTSAVIDPDSGFLYFGTDTTSGVVVKIRLSTFSFEDRLTLNGGDDRLQTAVIDTAKGYAYFGTYTSPATVIRVKLSDFTRDGDAPLSDGSGADQAENNLTSAVIDPAKEYAYFSSNSNSGVVVRIDIRENNFQRSQALNTGTDRILSSTIDPANNRAYFGTQPDSGSSEVVSVDLLTFSTEDTTTVSSATELTAAVMDRDNGLAYFADYATPATIYRIDPSASFARALALTGDLPLSPGARNFWAAVIDPEAGYAYFGSYEQQPGVAKVRLSDFSLVGVLGLEPTETGILSGVIDTANGFAYFGTSTNPAKVVKVRLSDFSRVTAITLEQDEERLTSAVIDTANGFAYFGTDTTPGQVIKINIDPANFQRVAAETLEEGQNDEDGEDRLTSAVIDPANGFAYFGTYTSPGKVVKINVEPNNFGRVGVAEFQTGEDKLTSAVIDPANGYAYFGTNTNPAHVVEVDVDPNNAFTRRGAAPLTIDRASSAVINPAVGKAYFGSQQQPGKVAEVALNPLAQQSTITMQNGENYLTSAVIDTAKGCAYFGSGDSEAGDFGSDYNPPGQSNRIMQVNTGDCKEGTTTTLTSAPNPSDEGQQVLLTAEVSAASGTPSGNVTFSEGATTLGTSALNAGQATLALSNLSAGPHDIVATYEGDATYAGSAAQHTHTVQDGRSATTTTLTASPNPSKQGNPVTFTATVGSGSGTPSGSVSFEEGGTTLGTGTLNNGVATLVTSNLSVGDHTIVAKYGGDPTYAPSNSSPYNQTVQPSDGTGGARLLLPVVLGHPVAATSISMTSSPNPSAPGQIVTFTAVVKASSGVPTGEVDFTCCLSDFGTSDLGKAPLVNGVATFKTSSLRDGTNDYYALYHGNDDFNFAFMIPPLGYIHTVSTAVQSR